MSDNGGLPLGRRETEIVRRWHEPEFIMHPAERDSLPAKAFDPLGVDNVRADMQSSCALNAQSVNSFAACGGKRYPRTTQVCDLFGRWLMESRCFCMCLSLRCATDSDAIETAVAATIAQSINLSQTRRCTLRREDVGVHEKRLKDCECKH